MRTADPTRLLVIAALLAVAVAACEGSQPASPPAEPSPSPPPAPQQTPSPEAAPQQTPSPEAAPRPQATVPASPRAAPLPNPGDRVAADRRPLEPEPFTDAGDLAEWLVAAERAIRDPATPADDLHVWAWLQQQAYRDLAVNPDWRDEVRAALPDGLRDAFEANLLATVRLREMTEPRDELPEWRIVEPPPAEELLAHYRAAADEHGVDWEVLAAIHLIETRMGRIDGVSVAGARGPMQFLPETWEHWGEGDIDDPGDAIRAAARYLVDHGAPHDLRAAVFAYNRSESYVDAVLAHAEVIAADERAYHGYYHWRVYYRHVDGDLILPEGFDGRR